MQIPNICEIFIIKFPALILKHFKRSFLQKTSVWADHVYFIITGSTTEMEKKRLS